MLGIDDILPDGDVPYDVTINVLFTDDPDYGNKYIGMDKLTQTLAFISYGEPDCAKVPLGTVCDGDYAADVCQPGTYRTSPGGECVTCGPGTYNPLFNVTGSHYCIECPPGSAAKEDGHSVAHFFQGGT